MTGAAGTVPERRGQAGGAAVSLHAVETVAGDLGLPMIACLKLPGTGRLVAWTGTVVEAAALTVAGVVSVGLPVTEAEGVA